MENITPPKHVLQVLRSLKARGYVAYLVGGCVRDMVLGVHPNDWDICTSALPEQVLEVFPHARRCSAAQCPQVSATVPSPWI